jgi:hypothetical protein
MAGSYIGYCHIDTPGQHREKKQKKYDDEKPRFLRPRFALHFTGHLTTINHNDRGPTK